MSMREWEDLPAWEQIVYLRGMNEHLKQEAKMAAARAGASVSDGSIQEGSNTESVPVDGDITDMLG